MSTLLRTSGRTTFGATSFGGRNYDYTKIYPPPDKPSEDGIEDNARVWNVYLDEAENYDADMIQGFQNILDSLLIFASLFSAVVTTFVAQTSQALQPDKSQTIISLLSENNELLRAAGNQTSINAIPAPSQENQTYTSVDVWVNGLFFTSLALSLSTALLSVLAKQWIQGYTAIVPGSAKARALVRHFRFQGLTKWHLGDIIESLPLILHSSVAIFLVGLALYVSQLSHPICVIVSVITALTFIFYFGTSALPAFDIACPYRITFMFWLAQPLLFGFRMARCVFLRLWSIFTNGMTYYPWPEIPKQSLKMAENSRVFLYKNHALLEETGRLACDSLDWLFDLSSNHSVKNVVVEGSCSLLHQWISHKLPLWNSQLSLCSSSNNLFLSTIEYSLSQLSSTSITEEVLKQSPYVNLIENIIKISHSKSLNGFVTGLKDDWQQKIESKLIGAYWRAKGMRYRTLSRRILDWGQPDMTLLESKWGRDFLTICVYDGDEEDIRDLVDQGIALRNWRDSRIGYTILHWAVVAGNLPGVKALVEREPSLISAETNFPSFYSKPCTPLDFAIYNGHLDVAVYLLDAGDKPSSNALHFAVWCWSQSPTQQLSMVKFLLDHGCDRMVKDPDGRTPVDVARSMGLDAIVKHLENYQTVRYPPLPSYVSPFK